MDEAGVRKVIAEKDLIVQIKDLVSTSISELKQSNESIASQQMLEIKRLKRDSVPLFNKKSNEEQYEPNKAIKDTVEDAQIALERNDFEKTKQLALDKGMDLLQGRQKLILILNHIIGERRSSNINTMISQTTKKMRKRYTGPNPEQLVHEAFHTSLYAGCY